MGIATRFGVAAAAALTTGGLLFFGNLAGGPAHAEGGSTRLIESPDCAVHDRVTLPASADPSSGAVQQAITVSVPATAILRVDRAGRVTAALTNTGCAPRPTDDVYLTNADGSLSPAPSKDVVRRPWTGDFTRPGVYVKQRS